MAYNEELAERVWAALGGREGLIEQKMFGGVAFMLGGNMLVGIVGDDLMVRAGPDRYAEALAQPHARPMDFTGRPMKGMVFVGPDGYATGEALQRWVELGLQFALSLPAKTPKTRGRPPRWPGEKGRAS